jgi:predicted HTH transcriptional regulator
LDSEEDFLDWFRYKYWYCVCIIACLILILMNVNSIPNLIPFHEDLRTEFKTSFNVSVIETLVAFANTSGGAVYIGMNDAGKVVGVMLAKESVQQWVNEIKSKTEPTLMPDVEILEVEGKKIVLKNSFVELTKKVEYIWRATILKNYVN